MKVMQLQAEHIKALKLVNITLDGENLSVSGEPGIGKTTLVDLVWMALDTKAIPGQPISRGRDKGHVTVVLGEPGQEKRISVRRVFNGGGSQLKVSSSDGKKVGVREVQAMMSLLTFDPLLFYQKKGLEQTEMMLKLLGVDVSDIDDKLASLISQRGETRKEIEALEAKTANTPTKVEKVSVSELSQELAKAREHNARFDHGMRKLSEATQAVLGQEKEIESLEALLLQKKEALKEAKAHLAGGRAWAQSANKVDEEAILDRISASEATNQQAQAWEDFHSGRKRLDLFRETMVDLESQIEEARASRKERLHSAPWPVDGLSVNEAGVLVLDGIPLEQCGESQKIRVSFAVASAGAPDLKICRIDGAEALGAGGRKELLETAKKFGMQVFLSRVADNGPEDGEITIEDGMAVKGGA